MRFLFTCGLLLFATSHCLAQDFPFAPKVEQIDRAIDMLVNIKSAVAKSTFIQSHTDKKDSIYKTLSIRITQCATVFNGLAKHAKPDDTPSPALHRFVSGIYTQAASVLYPGSFQWFKSDMDQAIADVPKLMEDKKKSFYFLRNCNELSERDVNRVVIAIDEILLTKQ